jgi:hypothetical protein
VRALGIVREIVDIAGGFFRVACYVVVPAAVFLETFALIGTVVPGDVIFALGGVYAARRDLALPVVLGSDSSQHSAAVRRGSGSATVTDVASSGRSPFPIVSSTTSIAHGTHGAYRGALGDDDHDDRLSARP